MIRAMDKKWIFSLLIALIAVSAASARDYYVLSVGIGDYPGTEADLKLPTADAKAIASVYKKSVGANVVVLLNEKATAENILRKGRELFSKAGTSDVVVFFYSGHGYQGGFATYESYLDYDQIKELFASCKAKNKMAFANACFSGGLIPRASTGDTPSFDSNVMLFLSSREDEYSWGIQSMKNNIFTACLIKCLKGAADADGNRVITARELFDAVYKGVVELSSGQQHPVMRGRFKDNMHVIGWRKK